ncbi:DEAD/DEAH box helicase [Terrimonas alba]|uniref:DEAD/DEAH box helicase n=1 Tax=Terrimonas alba TaxID=3349636 RepID=UPI0035F41A05
MAYELLSEPIRRYIRDKRWESLRPIQAAAISKILSTEENYILASRTASGKTEAAFLPILSKTDFKEKGIQVLYISPLIALINDQFVRIEELCKYLDVTVTKWHGEANKTLKEKLIKEPSGILLITPESLEAMFVNNPYYIIALFSNLKFIVIDEIHSFIGSERGTHLKSLISRIKGKCTGKIRTIGLSATIGDYDEAKRFTGEEDITKVLLDKTAKDVSALFKYMKVEGDEIPPSLITELYDLTKDKKVLIFPNSRGKAEEIAVKLKKLSEKKKGHPYYFSHHSSIDKELREYIEDFAKNNKRHNFCIICTSTLELGIDIGTVDLVVQVNSTFSIASLIQRVGRSGRKEGAQSNLLLYATKNWELLQSFACWELYKEGFIEPLTPQKKPFDILFHQILSVLKEKSGISRVKLLEWIKFNVAFSNINSDEVDYLIDYMIGCDFIEDLKQELIIGVEGEKLADSRSFYSVFKTDEKFKVINAGKSLGEIPYSLQVVPDENIFLAARVWKIVDVDMKANKIQVIPAKDGRKPLFFGTGGDIHSRIREKMLQLLYEPVDEVEAHESSIEGINDLKQMFNSVVIEDLYYDRPVLANEKVIEFYSFNGTKVNRTIDFLLKVQGIKTFYDEAISLFEFDKTDAAINDIIGKVNSELQSIESLIDEALEKNPHLFKFSKWGEFLPSEFKKSYLLERYFDPENTANFLKNLQLKHPR